MCKKSFPNHWQRNTRRLQAVASVLKNAALLPFVECIQERAQQPSKGHITNFRPFSKKKTLHGLRINRTISQKFSSIAEKRGKESRDPAPLMLS